MSPSEGTLATSPHQGGARSGPCKQVLPGPYMFHERHEGAQAIRYVGECSLNPDACPYCGGSAKVWGRAPRRRVVLDIPEGGKRVELHLQVKRFRCARIGRCGATWMQPLPGVSPHRDMTKRMVEWLGARCRHQTFRAAGLSGGASLDAARHAFADCMQEIQASVTIEVPQQLALLGTRIATRDTIVAINMQRQTVAELLDGQGPGEIGRYLAVLARSHRPPQHVSVGLSAETIAVVQEHLPGARAFVDAYHLMGLLDDAVLKARTRERANLSDHKRRACIHSAALLLKPRASLSGAELDQIKEWFTEMPGLGSAHRGRERLRDPLLHEGHAERGRKQLWSALEGLGHARGYFDAFEGALTAYEGLIVRGLEPDARQASLLALGDLSGLGLRISELGPTKVFEVMRANLLFPLPLPALPYTTPGRDVRPDSELMRGRRAVLSARNALEYASHT